MKHYRAPWSTGLIVMSVFAVLICFGIAFGTPLLPQPKHGGEIGMMLRWLPLAMAPLCALSIIRGYTITPGEILVHRLFWDTRLPRTGLQSATFDPKAMCKSLRTCGNGGFFSITGFYRNKTLGSYRAFVTDPGRSVILRYEKRTVVVSPDGPEEFVNQLTR